MINQRFPLSGMRLLACSWLWAACGMSTSVAQAQLLAITGARIETVSQAGTLDNGTLLIKDGKLEAVGKDIAIPVSAKRIDARGKTILPGIVDPYFVVTIGRNTQAAATRTVVFRGRTFVIGGGSPAIATSFAKIADGLDASEVDWKPSRRSGITTLHVVTGGYAQSLVARPLAATDAIEVSDAEGDVLVTVSNETPSLDVLRSNLKPPSPRSGSSTGRTEGGPPPSQTENEAGGSSRPSGPSPSGGSATAKLWSEIREGKAPVYVNVNNASAILHADAILAEYPKAKIVLIASGPDVYSTLQNLDAKRYTVILPPQIDRRPNSADRINVPKLLTDKGVSFAFSLSLGQSDFSSHQATPLLGVAMLVRAGLDRQTALEALTLAPAKLLGLEKEIGSLEVGKQANLVVFDDDPLSATASIQQVYVNGQPLQPQ